MAYRNHKSAQTGRKHTKRDNYTYIEGNTVRKLEVVEQEAPARRQLSQSTKKNRERELRMNLGSVLFLAAALASAAVVLIGYIQLQADVTLTVRRIAALESELNTLKLSNDEEYNRALSSVDLEEVRRVAIGELGMRYAKEGQIINVSGEGSDYVRQLAPIE